MKSIFDVNISNCIILNPIRHPDDMLRTFYVAIIVISVIFSILIVTMDGVFLVIIIKNKHLRTKPNILLLMMAIPDFLTGAVILPLHAFLTLNFYYVIRVCLLEYFLNMLGYAIVLLSLIVIIVVAIEIYLSVITPFFYQSYISKLKLLVVIATLWMVTILVSLLFTVYFYHHWVTYQCYASLAFVLLMFCITLAYEIIRREIKKIVLRASITQQLQHIQSDQKLLKTMYLVLGTFMLSFAPYILTTFIKMLREPNLMLQTYMMLGSETIALTKPVWNAFVYYLRLKIIRRCIVKELRFGWRTHPQNENTVM